MRIKIWTLIVLIVTITLQDKGNVTSNYYYIDCENYNPLDHTEQP